MPDRKLPIIEVGYQVFTADGTEEVGAVREVLPAGRPEIVVNIENAGDFVIPLEAVDAVHSQKVIITLDRLHPSVRAAILHAHDSEQPDL